MNCKNTVQEKIWPLKVSYNYHDVCENIAVVFILPNSSSLIQSMDEGVTPTFKTWYLKKKFGTSVKAVDDKNMSKRILEKFHC